ncbi:MAG TPA: hypothetical protein VN419_03605 [Humidesulfovibrio sp.]|uniref:hypothetical protein n=1 Tax=Humidesulfovibrio sp. TaxID=2910988 RepID=UPI002C12B8D8|nr:hypothetical protein [Humidesulfovibrio sp.]HWR03083.1 hypothetical protein [Humidesulfovibrio sp.]
MSEIAPISKGAAVEGPVQNITVPNEPRLPMGRQLTNVQPHPTPLIAAVEQAAPVPDEQAQRLHVAQMRSEITGTGNIMDVIA